tara:strand:- start:376 stop:864 length:489 start_codon:yes stop_codon:yes gene_type:complete
MTTRNNRRTTKQFSKTRKGGHKGGGFGLGMLASKETKFVKQVDTLIEIIGKMTETLGYLPKDEENINTKMYDIRKLMDRHKEKTWDSKRKEELINKTISFKNIIFKSDKINNHKKCAFIGRINGWTKDMNWTASGGRKSRKSRKGRKSRKSRKSRKGRKSRK